MWRNGKWSGPAESDPRHIAHVRATMANVQREIDAMVTCGATGPLLEEARRHLGDLAELLAHAERARERR